MQCVAATPARFVHRGSSDVRTPQNYLVMRSSGRVPVKRHVTSMTMSAATELALIWTYSTESDVTSALQD